MKKYLNKGGRSGVTGYDVAPESISVEFNHNATYLYTTKTAGKKVIEKMKQLALTGRGLSTYISQSVRDRFEKKLR